MAKDALTRELEQLIADESVDIVFQPIFNINSQELLGLEALSRGPVHSPLYSPVSLFRAAETNGRLSELETLCRRRALSAFCRDSLPGKLFINISPKALLDPNHPRGKTLQLLSLLGIPPSKVVIELSEQYPADDIDLLKECLQHYRNQGFLTAIDDLGAGYSGLRLWSELAPDFVKIDRHFSHGIDTNSVKQEFVRSIVELCQSLTCKVIAEGIESHDELATLKRLGVQYCQGYLLGKPAAEPVLTMHESLPVGLPIAMPRYGETAQSLCAPAVALSANCKLKEAGQMFSRQPGLQALVVMQQSRAVGLLYRNHLLELFSTPYGRALHESRPLHEAMDGDALQFQAGTPLSSVSQLLTADSETVIAQQFIILRGEELLGVGHTRDLLQRITDQRIKHARHANPLTGLPGNVPIQEELQRLRQMELDFELAYFDLNQFKPYNDVYGFSRGDEMIIALSELLRSHQSPECFIGHIGGDDFVMISTSACCIHICREVLQEFERVKSRFFREADWRAGFIESEDRLGKPCKYTLTGLSVGILTAETTRACSDESLSELAAAAKKQAKQSEDGVALWPIAV
ncbi:GGDEF domain-containing protein [Shewanella corallii]|uniref:GGDEF domain-containing protein n=1 Tax=Shewanella corallii TaxID=560080 RepID=A0ABT0N861_9GAMM|nr:GGDEF domain-containing protein [Shewanella corallii]